MHKQYVLVDLNSPVASIRVMLDLRELLELKERRAREDLLVSLVLLALLVPVELE